MPKYLIRIEIEVDAESEAESEAEVRKDLSALIADRVTNINKHAKSAFIKEYESKQAKELWDSGLAAWKRCHDEKSKQKVETLHKALDNLQKSKERLLKAVSTTLPKGTKVRHLLKDREGVVSDDYVAHDGLFLRVLFDGYVKPQMVAIEALDRIEEGE